MDSLFAPLPESVRIDGRCYALRTDHRTALRVCAALEDAALADFEKQMVLLALLYPQVPENTAEAVRLGLLFLNCGEPAQGADAPALYSLTKDAPLIAAALQKTHGVDVFAAPIHWYRFAALLCDVDENTFFARLVYLRRAKHNGTLTAAERRAAAALGDWMDLPHKGAPSAEAAEFLQLLGTAQKEELECTRPPNPAR